MNTLVSWIALVLAVVALGVALAAVRSSASSTRRHTAQDETAADLPQDTRALRHEVAALRQEQADSLKHLAVVRYDAFDDMGGHFSWSVAVLDDHGDGMVLTSIHGRSDARTYAKNINAWTCEQQLSGEETQAVEAARSAGPER